MPSRSSKHGRNKRNDTYNQQQQQHSHSQPPSPLDPQLQPPLHSEPTTQPHSTDTDMQSSLLLSPPTQLPTPLPERERERETMRMDKLVDVETPPGSLPGDRVGMGEAGEERGRGGDDEEDEEDDGDGELAATYRSPPFREAMLPVEQESPPPLPIPPRVYQSVGSVMGEDVEPFGSSPTDVHPYMIAPPLSQPVSPRTQAHISPRSSAHASPSAATRSPPRQRSYIQQEFEREYERTWDERDREREREVYHPQPTRPGLAIDTTAYDDGLYHHSYSHSTPIAPRLVSPASPAPSSAQRYGGAIGAYGAYGASVAASGLAQAIKKGGRVGLGISGVRGRDGEEEDLGATLRSPLKEKDKERKGGDLVLAKWDKVGDELVLMLAYEGGGVRVFGCGDLGGVEEVLGWVVGVGDVLGVEGDGEVRVVDLGVVKGLKGVWLAVLAEVVKRVERGDDRVDSMLLIYDMESHRVVKRVKVEGVGVRMEVGGNVIVVGTVAPASLVIYSAATLEVSYVVPASALELFAPPPVPTTTTKSAKHKSSHSASYLPSGTSSSPYYSHSPHNIETVSIEQARRRMEGRQSISLDDDLPAPRPPTDVHSLPRPVFSLHGRLLAYACSSLGGPPTKILGLAIPGKKSSSSSSPVTATNLDVGYGSLGSTHSTSASTASTSSTSSAFNAIRSLAAKGMGGGGVTQKELGSAAMKVGESVFSGMKFLGGMAVEALGGNVSKSAPDEEFAREDVVRRMRERERR
ncbi:hypothetical protein CVT24_008071, partial [Panaeolus cyanescens]